MYPPPFWGSSGPQLSLVAGSQQPLPISCLHFLIEVMALTQGWGSRKGKGEDSNSFRDAPPTSLLPPADMSIFLLLQAEEAKRRPQGDGPCQVSSLMSAQEAQDLLDLCSLHA